MDVIQKIYEYWPAAKAATVEALYTGGLREAKVSTRWIRENLPELTNWSRWTYPERITYLLFQPDLFPETLKFDYPKPRPRTTEKPIKAGVPPFQYELFPETLNNPRKYWDGYYERKNTAGEPVYEDLSYP